MKQTAQGLAALGRGPDTQLVHMAPSEVESLQRLAMAHGGSLTINPQTGLPEAGFLSSIMPMVIGAGLMAATGGTAAPLIAGMSNAAVIGMGVGGLQTLRTGSLSKGLMAGLGAYGGAGLAGGLMEAGMATTVPETAAATGITPPPAPAMAAPAAAPTAGIAPAAVPAEYSGFAPTGTTYGAFGEAPINAASQVATATTVPTAVASPFEARSALDAGLGQYYPEAPTVAGSNPLDTRLMGGQAATPLAAPPQTAGQFLSANKMPLGALGLSALAGMQPEALNAPAQNQGLIRPYTYSREKIPGAFQDVAGAPMSSKERRYFTDQFTALTPYKAPGPEYMAAGGPVEAMSNANALGENTGYPQAGISTGAYSTPLQRPMGQNVVTGAQDAAVDPYTGQAQFADGGSIGGYTYDQATGQYSGGAPLSDYASGNIGGYAFDPVTGQYARSNVTPEGQARRDAAAAAAVSEPINYGGGMASGGTARGGISDLGDYSDGGRLLRGPGDGVSDNIPAVIGKKRPARLADGEFVVPARIVSELGNGSTEAGARKLYAMMERVQKSRGKTVGKGKVAVDNKSFKHLPA